MKKYLLALPIAALASALAIGPRTIQPKSARIIPSATPTAFKIDPDFGTQCAAFIPNRGQTQAQALYYAKMSSSTLWLTKTALVLDSKSGADPEGGAPSRDVVRIEFEGANPAPEVIAQDPGTQVVNYLIGNDPAKWRQELATFRSVLYRNLYKNIDLKVYGRGGEFEYDWIVKPGGDAGKIRVRIEGEARPVLEKDGSLVLSTRHGEWTLHRPQAYQVLNGKPIDVQAAFKAMGQNTFGLTVGGYDKTQILMIDPVLGLKFSSFLRGSKDEAGRGLAVSAKGFIYIAGYTDSSDFPTKAGYNQVLAGGYDVFVTKLPASGQGLIYSTYIGGKGSDLAYGLAVDATGAAYVTGSTESADFPVKNAFKSTPAGNEDAFVLKLSPTGGVLVYSTYLGGQGSDAGLAIGVDGQGCACVTGKTASSNFPLVSALDSKIEGQEAFVAKLSPSGTSLIYSTFLGGKGTDAGRGIALDSGGGAYVTGSTDSTDFPVANAFSTSAHGGLDAFVARISPTGRSLIFSTYLGGASDDVGYGIALDSARNVYVTGQTASPDFPLKNAYDITLGGRDAFVAKLDALGKNLVYSTFLGGLKEDAGYAIVVAADHTAWVTGFTKSSDFPTAASVYETYTAGRDAFLTQLSADGAKLVSSACFGGSGNETAYALALSADGFPCLTGATSSADFPTVSTADKAAGGGEDVFSVKFAAVIVEVRIDDVDLVYGWGAKPVVAVDVWGQNFGSQGQKQLVCDGVLIPREKVQSWSSSHIRLSSAGWLDDLIYVDHNYSFAIEEYGAVISNTHLQRFLMHIFDIWDYGDFGYHEVAIEGYNFGTEQGSNVVRMDSDSGSWIVDVHGWGPYSVLIGDWSFATPPAGDYDVYIQRDSQIISEVYRFHKWW